MHMLTAWERGDALGCHVCLLVSPHQWGCLRVAHKRFALRLDHAEVRSLFFQRLQIRADASAGLDHFCHAEEETFESITPLLSLAATVDAVADVVQDVVTYPRLAPSDLGPLQQVLRRLHRLALGDRELMPRERSGRRSSLLRRLLRSFASFSGLLPGLVALLVAFPAQELPCGVFVTVCEVLASLIHNTKESKRLFLSSGGIGLVLATLKARHDDSRVQAAGLAALLALSARSVISIRLMADAGVHEVVVVTLKNFFEDDKVVARSTGVLANMSNVPCVCETLKTCGVLTLARELLVNGKRKDSVEMSPFVRDFVQYLLSNLQDNDSL